MSFWSWFGFLNHKKSSRDFFVFYIKNVNNQKTICSIKKIIRTFVDAHAAMHLAHIPNMHRATFYRMLCIFDVRFGAFSMVNLALKCTKK